MALDDEAPARMDIQDSLGPSGSTISHHGNIYQTRLTIVMSIEREKKMVTLNTHLLPGLASTRQQ